MSAFSAGWLRLREPVDLRSRNPAVASALRAAFAGGKFARGKFARGKPVTIVDIGCGTGANLRATSPLLGPNQHWSLVDHDPALLDCARDTLAGWADAATATEGGLALRKDGRFIGVSFRQADLMVDIEAVLDEARLDDTTGLVTASAFFDLASPAFIQRFVNAVIANNAYFYTVLTYNGVQTWTSPTPEDALLVAAFNAHQAGDKGFGPAAGPVATTLLQDALIAAGYDVQTGDSPWHVGPPDGALLQSLTDGVAEAVAETGRLGPFTLQAWRAHTRTAAMVGHTDLLAVPPR